MSMAELEQLWATSKPGAVKIFMIQARGFVESAAAAANPAGQDAVRVASVGTDGAEAGSDGSKAPDIGVGDRVWLSNRNFRLEQGRARKLEPLYFGPYEVMEMHGSNAARLRMPDGCRLHPVFNLDLLRKFVDGRSEFPERPVHDHRPGPVPEEDAQAGGPGEPEYEVEAIIGSRGRGARMSYRVKWLGWPVEQASWRPAAECRQTCPQRVREFEEQQLRRLQAVQLLRQVEVERRQRRAQWSTQGTQSSEESAACSHVLHCVSVPEKLRIAVLCRLQSSVGEELVPRVSSAWSHTRRPFLQRELQHRDGRMLLHSDSTAHSPSAAPRHGESVPTPVRSQQLHAQLHLGRVQSQGGRRELDEGTGRKDSMRSIPCMSSFKASTGDSEMRAAGASMAQRSHAEMPRRSSASEKQHAVAVACTRPRADRAWMDSVQEEDEHMQAVDVSSDPRAVRSREQHSTSDAQGTRTSRDGDEETSLAPLQDPRQGSSIEVSAQKHDMTVSHPAAGSIAGGSRSAAPPMVSERPASCALSCGPARLCVADQSRGGQRVSGERTIAGDSAAVRGFGGVKSYPAAEPWKDEGSGGAWGERDVATVHEQGQSPRRSSSLLQDRHTCQLGHTRSTHSPEDLVSSGTCGGRGGSLLSYASAAGQVAKEEPCGIPHALQPTHRDAALQPTEPALASSSSHRQSDRRAPLPAAMRPHAAVARAHCPPRSAPLLQPRPPLLRRQSAPPRSCSRVPCIVTASTKLAGDACRTTPRTAAGLSACAIRMRSTECSSVLALTRVARQQRWPSSHPAGAAAWNCSPLPLVGPAPVAPLLVPASARPRVPARTAAATAPPTVQLGRRAAGMPRPKARIASHRIASPLLHRPALVLLCIFLCPMSRHSHLVSLYPTLCFSLFPNKFRVPSSVTSAQRGMRTASPDIWTMRVWRHGRLYALFPGYWAFELHGCNFCAHRLLLTLCAPCAVSQLLALRVPWAVACPRQACGMGTRW